jgi:hypothetical protein
MKNARVRCANSVRAGGGKFQDDFPTLVMGTDFELVLVDNDPIVIDGWNLWSQGSGYNPRRWFAGEDLARDLVKLGFARLVLATGFDSVLNTEDIGLLGIIGKEPREALAFLNPPILDFKSNKLDFA